MGAGMCLACACDMRIAEEKAKLGFNFSKLGLHPGMAATFFLPKLVGQEVCYLPLHAKLTVIFLASFPPPTFLSRHIFTSLSFACVLQTANYLLMSGELVSGAVAKEMGLVFKAEKGADMVQSAAQNIAAQIDSASPLGVSLVTNTLRHRTDVGLQMALQREADGQAASYASAQFKVKIEEMIAATSSTTTSK